MKKFNAKYITRTIIYSECTFIEADLEKMEMKEVTHTLIGSYSNEELLEDARETYGPTIVGIKEVKTIEEKRRISVEDFMEYSEVVTKEDET